jgi:predicted TIM-barrel fold metal-dependent hydrolase
MRGDMFVFDNVVHAFDLTEENVAGSRVSSGYDHAVLVERLAGSYGSKINPANPKLKGTAMTPERAYEYMFANSQIDMAVAQTVPLFAYFKDGFAPAARNYELARAFPDRFVFCGGVDPLWQGVEAAVDELERQHSEWNATSFKFYQTQYDRSWRADDEKLAYPLYEKCLELGITNVQFHKGIPFAFENIEDLRPNDLQKAARDFPKLTFVIHHLGMPYVDETMNIAGRFPNIWVALSGWVNAYPLMPYECLHALGKALMFVGPDRLLWGTESFLAASVQPWVELFATIQIPDELQDKHGYPPITDEARRKMFGLNQARLLGMDVDRQIAKLRGQKAVA